MQEPGPGKSVVNNLKNILLTAIIVNTPFVLEAVDFHRFSTRGKVESK